MDILRLWYMCRINPLSPAEIERDITIPLEESLSTLTGLKSVKSSSSENSSRITLEYESAATFAWQMVEIRDRVDRVRYKLPNDVRQVMIYRWSYGQIPVIFMAVIRAILQRRAFAQD